MIHAWAENISSFFIDNSVISENDRKVYSYCFELLISELINILIILAVAILSKQYVNIAVFLISFLLLRKWAGGYHANTHYGCTLILFLILTLFIVSEIVLSYNAKCILQFFNIFTSLPIICIFAPVDNSNKPIKDEQRKKFKTYCIIITVALIGVICFFHLIKFEKSYELSCGMFIVAVSILAAKLKESKHYQIKY